MNKIPKIILSRPKIVFDVKCPKCKKNDIVGLPIIETQCKNCKTKYSTEAEINMYYSIAKKLNQLVGKNNEVWVQAERDVSTVFHAEDMLRPRSKYEDDYFQTLMAIKDNYEDMNCWDIGEITNEYDEEYKRRCSVCGHCLHCVTCYSCHETYIPKEVKTSHGIEKRYTCPHCNSKEYKQTRIKIFEIKDNKQICPYCKSDNVDKTLFNSNKQHCPSCGTKVNSICRKVPVYRLIIKRQKRNWIKEDKE